MSKEKRVLPEKDVYLILAVWKEVCGKYGVQFVEELKPAVKLLRCVQTYVEGWGDWDLGRKVEWLGKYLEWVMVSGKRFSSVWRWVVQYLDAISVEDGVEEVVEAYKRYVKNKFGKDVIVDLTKKEVVVAARVIKKVASEMGLSVEDVIKFQHECWEKIDRPLVFERMSDEGKVRRRVEVYLDVKRKSGEVVKRESKVEESEEEKKKIKNIWKDVLKVGVMLYTKKGGFIGSVARECWDRLSSVRNLAERLSVLQSYTPDKVYERWVKEGKPALFE